MSGVFVFTTVVMQEKNVVAEIKVDSDALQEHSEELGLEMEADELKMLLKKALEQRPCVDVEIETENDAVKEVYLSLTYKFSSTISRKGIFQLPIVSEDAPQSLVKLLASIHATPPQPMLSELQKAEKEEKRLLAGVTESSWGAGGQKISTLSKQGIAAASQNSDIGTTTATVNLMMVKRRHVPTGTMRRKGSKGAKLAKK